MRALLPVAMSALLATGCTAYLKAQNRTAGPRGEAGQIAMGGVAQIVVGALVTVGSYYLYQHADQDPARDGLTGSHAGVAGAIVGSGLVLGGLADGTIALYQALAGDHLFAAPYKSEVKSRLNASVRTPMTP
jgi:hypothetical protein